MLSQEFLYEECESWWHYKCDETTYEKVKTEFKDIGYICKEHAKKKCEEKEGGNDSQETAKNKTLMKESYMDNEEKIKTKYYTVKNGKKNGIYTSWEECQQQTSGIEGAIFKSFQTQEQAQEFLNETKEDGKQDIEKKINIIRNNGMIRYEKLTLTGMDVLTMIAEERYKGENIPDRIKVTKEEEEGNKKITIQETGVDIITIPWIRVFLSSFLKKI